MSFPVTEIETQLRYAAQVVLDPNGNGTLTFDPASARERWEVQTVVVSTNQAATATVVPVATVGKNTADLTQLSQGNSRGASWSGNQDTFAGLVDISPADYLSVMFSTPPGQANTTTTATGTVTSPGTFRTIATLNLPSPGPWTITWSCTLSGTLSSNDANNFELFAAGSVSPAQFLAISVNTASASTFPQTAVAYTAPQGGVQILLTSGPTTPTSGAVYAGTLSVTGSPVAGVIAYATVTGKRYTRRA